MEKEAKHKPVPSGKCQMGVHKFTFVRNSVSCSKRLFTVRDDCQVPVFILRWNCQRQDGSCYLCSKTLPVIEKAPHSLIYHCVTINQSWVCMSFPYTAPLFFYSTGVHVESHRRRRRAALQLCLLMHQSAETLQLCLGANETSVSLVIWEMSDVRLALFDILLLV